MQGPGFGPWSELGPTGRNYDLHATAENPGHLQQEAEDPMCCN